MNRCCIGKNRIDFTKKPTEHMKRMRRCCISQNKVDCTKKPREHDSYNADTEWPNAEDECINCVADLAN